MDTDTEIMAKTIYGEARGEGISGMEAVANVIINRVKKPCWWGKTIRDVCLKPMQFSCWNTDDPNRAKLNADLSDDPVFDVCKRIAVRAIRGLLPDKTKGSTHYHALSVHPRWASALVPNTQIGHHLFYTCL